MLINSRVRLCCGLLAILLLITASAAGCPALASEPTGLPTSLSAETAAPARHAFQPMVFARMRATDRCGRRCPEWVAAEGVVTPNSPENFRRLLGQIGDDSLPIVLDSPGGDLDAALAIGRMIRAKGLITIIGRNEVQGCALRDAACLGSRSAAPAHAGFVSASGACAGSCLLLLAAGTQRIGYWITEASFPAPETFKTRTAGAAAPALIATYLADMGISAGLLPRLRRSGLPLDRAEMLHFGLSTGRLRVEDFTGASICLRAIPAANCLLPAAAPPPARVSAKPPATTPAAPRSAGVIIWGAIGEM